MNFVDAVLLAEVFAKKTQKTPKQTITTCKKRFARYDLRMRT